MLNIFNHLQQLEDAKNVVYQQVQLIEIMNHKYENIAKLIKRN